MAPEQENRTAAIAVSLCAAAGLIFALFSRQWLVNGLGDELFGLREHASCSSHQCAVDSNAAFVAMIQGVGGRMGDLASSAFSPAGWVTSATCALAALGLLVAAALALAGARPNLPISPSTIALLGAMAGLIAGCVFVATKPGEPGFIGIGMGFWVFGISSVAAIAGAQLLAKVNRPPDPDLMDDAMNPDQF